MCFSITTNNVIYDCRLGKYSFVLPYRLDVPGRSGWLARYLKEVDAEDTTLRFWQEIYDDQGRLVEIHEKYPLDKATGKRRMKPC